ncbi:hypothetical protein E0E52_10525 [Azotobacter chroococcum]|uniref:DUF6941 family protein n=1 Tax=Azotobacter chroococcum TaxID=353 RepID=UPI00103F4330|nr:hypothetical protein [Azotobacter chroococcum]TBW07883.1 hypothetical protein E0E52_10525 [Azotobacter chroococcum]
MSRFAYSLFCDDVRHEINGKTSQIGIYQGSMYLATFPAHLPKLCIIISAVTPIENPFSELIFKAYMDVNLIFQFQLNKEQLDEAIASSPEAGDGTFRIVQTMGIVSPISFDQPCRIRLEVEADGETIECPGLRVIKAPEGMKIIG